jgi:hypothetical protein
VLGVVVAGVLIRRRDRVTFPTPSTAQRQVLAQLPAYLHRKYRTPYCAVQFLGASGDTIDVEEACLSPGQGPGWYAPAVITVRRNRPVGEAQPVSDADSPELRRMFPSAAVRRELWQLDSQGMPPAVAARLRAAAR